MRHLGSRLLVSVLLSGAAALGAFAQDATVPSTSAGSIVTLAAPAVSNFWLTAQIKAGGQGVEFHGFVPDEATRAGLMAVSGADVTNLELAGGAPAAFQAGLSFGLDVLARLSDGRIALRSNVLTIKGTAKSTDDEAAIQAMLKAGAPDGVVVALTEIAPPAEGSKPPANTDKVTVPTEAPLAAPEGEATPAVEAAPAGDAVPAVPATGGSAAADQPAPAAAPEASAAQDEPAKPAAEEPAPVSIEPATPAVDPAYAFTASRKAGGVIELSGSVPTDPALRYFSVVAGGVPTSGVTIASGAPEAFTANAVEGLRALALLSEGTLRFANGKWSIQGKAANDSDLASAKRELASSEAGAWMVDLSGPPPNDVCRTDVAGFAATHTILFRSGSAQMTDESRIALKDLASILEKCPDATVHVEGHTDADGDERVNLALSVARAEAVAAALVEEGVKDTRLYAIGYGESMPIASNDTPAGKQQNRRIVFTVLDEHK